MPAANDLVRRPAKHGQELVDRLLDRGRVGLEVPIAWAAGDAGLEEAEYAGRRELGMRTRDRPGEALGIGVVELRLKGVVLGGGSDGVTEIVPADGDVG